MILTRDQLREAADLMRGLPFLEQPLVIAGRTQNMLLSDIFDAIVDLSDKVTRLENAMREEGR